jgi:hypothetical protein
MLAQHIGGIISSQNLLEINNAGCKSFSNSMIGQGIVPFVDWRLRLSRTCDNQVVVSKHNSLSLY